MIKLISQIFVLFFSFQLAHAQSWKLVDSIQINDTDKITDFGVDDLNNIYYITNYSELNKINLKTKKKELSSFSNRTILENLNTQNVLQITLKSGIFNLVILDNQLNPIQDKIEFPFEANFTPTLTALVDNNYLWGYDPLTERLVLWNYQENKIRQQSVILGGKVNDGYYGKLIYQNNKIYLLGSEKILIFDEFANLEKVIPFQTYDQIILKNSMFYFSKNDKIFQFDLNNQQTTEIEIETSFDYFSINHLFLFVLKDKLIYIYQHQKS